MAFATIPFDLAKLVRDRAYRRIIDEEDNCGRDANDRYTDEEDIVGRYTDEDADERNVDISSGIALVPV